MHSNRHTPKISVITVTYNAGEVLEDTIQSVISQTWNISLWTVHRETIQWLSQTGIGNESIRLSANPTKDCMMQ